MSIRGRDGETLKAAVEEKKRELRPVVDGLSARLIWEENIRRAMRRFGRAKKAFLNTKPDADFALKLRQAEEAFKMTSEGLDYSAITACGAMVVGMYTVATQELKDRARYEACK